MVRIKKVKPLTKFLVRLELTDGKKKVVDLEPYLFGPVFREIRNKRSEFLKLRVEPRLGTIVWDSGADIDPDVLLGVAIPEWMEYNTPSKFAAVKEKVTKYKRNPFTKRAD